MSGTGEGKNRLYSGKDNTNIMTVHICEMHGTLEYRSYLKVLEDGSLTWKRRGRDSFPAIGESLGVRKKEGVSKEKRQENNLEEDKLWKLSVAKRCLLQGNAIEN